MKKIYISGAITGLENAQSFFDKAEIGLSEAGWDVVNPMKINHEHDKTWSSYMREDVKALCGCDAIFMLDNWKGSKGAKIEHDLAKVLGLDMIYEKVVNPSEDPMAVIKERSYTIKYTHHQDGSTKLSRKSDGFNAFELLGLLDLTRGEIILQMQGNIKPDFIERQVIVDKKSE